MVGDVLPDVLPALAVDDRVLRVVEGSFRVVDAPFPEIWVLFPKFLDESDESFPSVAHYVAHPLDSQDCAFGLFPAVQPNPYYHNRVVDVVPSIHAIDFALLFVLVRLIVVYFPPIYSLIAVVLVVVRQRLPNFQEQTLPGVVERLDCCFVFRLVLVLVVP